MSIQLLTTDPMPDHILDIQWGIDDRSALPDEAKIKAWCGQCLDNFNRGSIEVCIRVVDLTEMQKLNNQFRGKDKPTNVLSFGGDDEEELMVDENGSLLLGDVIICKEVVVQEAMDQGKSVQAHFSHLLIHGLLHLQGHDHSVDDQAIEMEFIEKNLMQQFGFDDPYR